MDKISKIGEKKTKILIQKKEIYSLLPACYYNINNNIKKYIRRNYQKLQIIN